jgi:hypothetical protein
MPHDVQSAFRRHITIAENIQFKKLVISEHAESRRDTSVRHLSAIKLASGGGATGEEARAMWR